MFLGSATPHSRSMTEKEKSLQYDRQIRIWGVDSQSMLDASRVLVIGLNGLMHEVAKNLVLAGITVDLWNSDETISAMDLTAGFFFRPSDIGQKKADVLSPRLAELNRFVSVSVRGGGSPSRWVKSGVYSYSLVIQCSEDVAACTAMNDICRECEIPFISASVYGDVGLFFVDAGPSFSYWQWEMQSSATEKEKEKEKEKKKVWKTLSYASLAEYAKVSPSADGATTGRKRRRILQSRILVDSWIQSLRLSDGNDGVHQSVERERGSMSTHWQDMLERRGWITSPMASILGGELAQEAIKIMTKHNAPIHQIFIYSEREGRGTVEA